MLWSPSGMIYETYDYYSGGWWPGTSILRSGYGALLFNPDTNAFQVEISGLPPYPARTLPLQRNVPGLVGRQLPASGRFKDILGYAPQNGTKVTRALPGQGQTDYTFNNNAWQPAEPIAARGEALWVTLPCLYVGGPSNFVLEAVSPQGALMPQINVSSYCGGQVGVDSTPPQGSMLGLGMHFVNCQATNTSGSSASWMFTVSVVDTAAPAIQCPDMVVESIGPQGAPVTFNALALDLADPSPQLVCSPPSGSIFPIGKTVVQCTAWDASGNTNQAQFLVTVADTRAPQIACPGDLTLVKTRPDGADLMYQLVFWDFGDPNPMVEYSIPPGGTVGPGTTTVNCAVTDTRGNRSTCSFNVHVVGSDPVWIGAPIAQPNAMLIPFPTQLGVEYDIQYKDALTDPDWQPLGTVLGTGAVIFGQDIYPSETARFYRVVGP
jgi:hypothetical protein